VQKLTLARLSAVVLALAGIVLVTGWFGIHALHPDRLGVLAGLLAAFSFAFYNIAGHDILSRYDSWKVLLYVTLTASLFWAAVNPPARVAATHYTVAQWLFLIGFALISLLLPYSLYLAGLSYLDPARAIVVSCLEPAFSIVLAALFLGETLRPAQGLGIVLVLGAVVAARA
jgi:drug/metabolite transporter (DMT)-like permease